MFSDIWIGTELVVMIPSTVNLSCCSLEQVSFLLFSLFCAAVLNYATDLVLLLRLKNASLILACSYPELVSLRKVIFCNLHIPVIDTKLATRLLFAGVCHGQ